MKYLKNGQIEEKHESKVVVGDILIIEGGKSVPADGIIVSGKGVECDESGMTGESIDCKKDILQECSKIIQQFEEENRPIDHSNLHEIPSPVLLSGSQIKTGEGKYVVIAVGEKSCIGRVLASLRERPTTTPLQKKLEGIASFIGKIGLYVSLLTVVGLFARFFIMRGLKGGWDNSDVATCFGFVVLGITVLIMAIPEGLPLAVTIALAHSVRRMYTENNFVKTLMSCEVMGNANYICSDKTGTLTKNQMDIVKIWFDNSDIHLDVDAPNINLKETLHTAEISDLICESLACNTLALKKGGNATELACIKLLEKSQYKIDETRDQYLTNKKYTRFFFDSKRKKMSTIIQKSENAHRLHIKGAAERILKSCDKYMAKDGIKELTEDIKKNIFRDMDEYNKEALRTITVAYKDMKPHEFGEMHDEKNEKGENIVEESGLILLCILGIRDTLRPGVQDAVNTCHKAGIKVIMVTGDNITTARTIAKNCGILKQDHEYAVLEGEKFNSLLGGLMRKCTNCDKEITEDDLKKQKGGKSGVDLAKSVENGSNQQNEADQPDSTEKGLQQYDQCPFCNKKTVVEKVRNLEKFQEIEPHLFVIARSHPLDKYLLVTALKELYFF